MKKTIIGITSIVCTALVLSMPAMADIIEMDYSGQIYVEDNYGHFNGVFHDGEAYTGTLIYDSSSPALSTYIRPDGSFSTYQPILSLEMNIGDYTFQSRTSPDDTPNLYVQDYTPGNGNDALLAVGDPGIPDFMTFPDAIYSQINFIAEDSTGNALSSSALPTTFSFDPSAVGTFTPIFFGNADGEQAFLGANIQSLTVTDTSGTPEPSTWLLLFSGVAGLVFWKRHSGPKASNTFPGTPPLRG